MNKRLPILKKAIKWYFLSDLGKALLYVKLSWFVN
jgi:hypothetical protein